MENEYKLYDCLGCSTNRGVGVDVQKSSQNYEFESNSIKSNSSTINLKVNTNVS